METRGTSSIGLFVLPLLVMGCLHLVVTPLGDLLSISWVYLLIWYAVAILLGYVLLRRTRVTKDHEYRRSEIMKKMKHVYDAEAKGVWEQDTPLQSDGQVSIERLDAKVGSFGREAPELELNRDVTSDVAMLSEQGFVQKATRRMNRNGTEMEDAVDSTVGSVRKKSWMDGVIDGLFNMFGKDKEAEREEQRIQRLRANAEQSPVIAQRPVAPIRETIASTSSSDENLTMTTMSDDGGIISSTSQDNSPKPLKRNESIEDLAMLSGGNTFSKPLAVSGTCPTCGVKNPPSERYCSACGATLFA